MPDEPEGHKVTGVEGEVEICGEVAEEIDREVVSLIEDPDGQDMFRVREIPDTPFDIAPELCAAESGFQAERQGQ